jgi:MOSC domain-containing protein YiiM
VVPSEPWLTRGLLTLLSGEIMFEGTVISINITPIVEGPMQTVDEVRAVPGRGLEGDRYFYHPQMEPKRELTLVEAEAIEAFRSEFKIDFGLEGTRRNLITRGVPLNHLVGREFWIGGVKARGIQLCEPCATLQRLSHPKVLPGLIHRGGLRAQILTEGTIRVGEVIRES